MAQFHQMHAAIASSRCATRTSTPAGVRRRAVPVQAGDVGRKRAPGKALVAEKDHPGADQLTLVVQHGLDDVALAEVGRGKAPRHRQAVRGDQGRQPEAPAVAVVALAAAGQPGQLSALDGLAAGRRGEPIEPLTSWWSGALA